MGRVVAAAGEQLIDQRFALGLAAAAGQKTIGFDRRGNRADDVQVNAAQVRGVIAKLWLRVLRPAGRDELVDRIEGRRVDLRGGRRRRQLLETARRGARSTVARCRKNS